MRMNKYITDTKIARQLGMDREINNIVGYLAANRTVIADPQDLSSIFSARTMSTTHMSNIFTRCITTKYLPEFATIANPSPSVVHSIPGMLTMPVIVIDLKQSSHAEKLNMFRELYNKIVMNITHLVKVNRSNGSLELSSLHELHSMYVKATLVRNYFDSDRNEWLSPVLRQFIVRTYSLFISSIISRVNQLNHHEFNDVASIFALYMQQMLAGSTGDITCPAGYLNINYLGNRSDLLYVSDKCREYTKDILTIDLVCKILSEVGPPKLKNFSTELFLKQCASLGTFNDPVSTYLAFDYPPYWVYLLLSASSGLKASMMSKLLQQFNLKQGCNKFVEDLIVNLNVTK